MESASDRTRRLREDNPAVTARKLMEELRVPEEAIAVLLSWVTDRVRATLRTDVRRAEEDAWASPSGKPRERRAVAYRTQTGALPALDNLDLLLSLPVLVPIAGDGRQAVAWRDMTVADHKARIGMLREPIVTTLETVSRHEWSIKEINRHGVRCLGDIDPALLRADLTEAGLK